MNLYRTDKKRKGDLPLYQFWFRYSQSRNTAIRTVSKLFFKLTSFLYSVDISSKTKIGPGLFIGHPYNITINGNTIIGKNCNIHKGVTLGQENRGKRKGSPIIGNNVWLGINSTVVGKVIIGDDVMIAPNCYINCDIPSHSIVIGNPCKVISRNNATEGYINNTIN